MHTRAFSSGPAVLLLAALALVACAAGGCDTSLDAFADSDKYYSVFGYLDAAADTQWVRIDPLRDSVLVGTEPFEARVTTTNLSTGETSVWQRKIINLAPDPAVTLLVQNYYTTADIAPEATYRFKVESEDGKTTTAEVTIPPDFTVSYRNPPQLYDGVTDFPLEARTFVTARGADRLGAVIASYSFKYVSRLPDGTFTPPIPTAGSFSYLADTVRTGNGAWEISVYWAKDILQLLPPRSLVIDSSIAFHVTAASASEDWPNYAMPVDSLAEAPQPPAPGLASSNIENGVGYLGGAVVYTLDIPVIVH